MNYKINQNTPVKTCCKCKEEKPLTEFYTDNSAKDSHGSACKSCHKMYVKKWEQTRGYYIQHNNKPRTKTKPFTLYLNKKHLGCYSSRLACEKVQDKHHLKQVLDAREMAEIEAKAQEEYYL